MLEVLTSLTVSLLFILSLGILLVNDWRWMMGLLALQYGGVTLLISQSWPLEIALVKVVAGWMAAAVLGVTYLNRSGHRVTGEPQEIPDPLFRSLLAVLAALSIASFLPEALKWFIGASRQQVLGGLLLFGIGLIQVGLAVEPTRLIVGLLTILSGFEVLYATVEASVLMTALLAINHIGLAFLGSYLLNISTLEVWE